MTATRRLYAGLVTVVLAAGGLGVLGTAPATAGTDVDPDAAVAYQQNPAHDGHSSDPSFTAPLTKTWSKTLSGTVGYPLIADGRVFVTVAHTFYGNDVVALSLATGKVLWGPTSINGVYNAATIGYDAGRLFAINHNGVLTAFDAATGAVDWTKQMTGQYSFTSAPTAVDGIVYIVGAGVGATLYAVDGATGTTLWTGDGAGGDHIPPAVDDDGGIYLASGSSGCHQAFKYDVTGAQVWRNQPDCMSGSGSASVLHDGRLYSRDVVSGGEVLDTTTGAPVGTFAADPAPAFEGDRMATVSDGDLTVSTLSGDPLWHTKKGDAVTAPLIANGHVIQGLRDGTVEVRRVQNGELEWSGQAGAALEAPDENNADVLTGLAQGDGALVVPAGPTISAFLPVAATEVTISSGPAYGALTGPTATFGFTAPFAHAEYECTLDGDTQPCTSPFRLDDLTTGTHSFTVALAHATTGAATRRFRVDASAPEVRVAPFGSRDSAGRTATAHWSATDVGSGVDTYQARIRRAPHGKPFAPWSARTPTTATSTSFYVAPHARYCVSVRARDRVGNWSDWSSAQCARRR